MKGSCHCGKVAYAADVALRCAEDIDLATVKPIAFDGANKL